MSIVNSFWIIILAACFSIPGCSKKPDAPQKQAPPQTRQVTQSPITPTPDKAILDAQQMPDSTERSQYLIDQAKVFLKNKKYKEAIQTARYVLVNIDKYSQEAKNIIQKSQDDERKMAQVKNK